MQILGCSNMPCIHLCTCNYKYNAEATLTFLKSKTGTELYMCRAIPTF